MKPDSREAIGDLVSDETLSENVVRNIEYVAILYKQAQDVHIPVRTVYYKSAIMFAAAVVEALTYELVKRHSKKYEKSVMNSENYKPVHILPEDFQYKASSKNLVICKREKISKSVEDRVNFVDLNNYCKRHDVFDSSEHRKVDYVRNVRNKIHIQSLDDSDTGYTKRKLEAVSSRIDLVIDKIKNI